MAPIKFEEHIKDTLEKRTITPSAESWSNLSERLDAEEKQNKKPIYFWFSIAASIAALVFVSVTYFNTTEEETTIENTIAEEQTEDVIKLKSSEIRMPKEEIEVVKTNIEIQVEDEKKDIRTELIPVKKSLVIVPEQETKLAVIEKVELTAKNEVTDAEITKLLNEVEFKSVVTELQNLKKEANSTVTDREIDSLLKMASRELFREKIMPNKTIVTSADALLQSVEDEIDQSFRSRIYDALKNGLKEVKLAVANRNN